MLINAGADVTGYALEPPTDPDLFSLAAVSDRMNNITGDIRDFEHLKEVFEECAAGDCFSSGSAADRSGQL
jgi:CDP-glucose 4,6-dehydratase